MPCRNRVREPDPYGRGSRALLSNVLCTAGSGNLTPWARFPRLVPSNPRALPTNGGILPWRHSGHVAFATTPASTIGVGVGFAAQGVRAA